MNRRIGLRIGQAIAAIIVLSIPTVYGVDRVEQIWNSCPIMFTNNTGQGIKLEFLVAVVDGKLDARLKYPVTLKTGEIGEARITGVNCDKLGQIDVGANDIWNISDKGIDTGHAYKLVLDRGANGYTITPADISLEHILKRQGS